MHPHKFQNCTSKLFCLNKSHNIMTTNKCTSSDDWVQKLLVVQQLAYYWIIINIIVARIQPQEKKAQRLLWVGCSRSSSQGSRSWSRFTDSAGSFIGLFSPCLVFSLLNFRFSLGTFFHSLVCLSCWKMW